MVFIGLSLFIYYVLHLLISDFKKIQRRAGEVTPWVKVVAV